jgi:hypothetical protein
VKKLSQRLIITFTGAIRIFFRTINRILGFFLVFTGAWFTLLFYGSYSLVSLFSRDFRLWVEEFNYSTGTNLSAFIFWLSFIISVIFFVRNWIKFYNALPADSFILRVFFRREQPEREGNNVPGFMMKSERHAINGVFLEKNFLLASRKIKTGIF